MTLAELNTLIVGINLQSKVQEVSSVEEAVAKFIAYRDDNDLGISMMRVRDGNLKLRKAVRGKKYHVSYNGRVWEYEGGSYTEVV